MCCISCCVYIDGDGDGDGGVPMDSVHGVVEQNVYATMRHSEHAETDCQLETGNFTSDV